MSFFSAATEAFESTQGINVNPSTSALIAEIDSTALLVKGGGQNFQVTWIVGGSTAAIYQLEQCLSTGLDMSTAGRSQTNVVCPKDQSAQYMTKNKIRSGDRLRVRMNAAQASANMLAKIIAEPLE